MDHKIKCKKLNTHIHITYRVIFWGKKKKKKNTGKHLHDLLYKSTAHQKYLIYNTAWKFRSLSIKNTLNSIKASDKVGRKIDIIYEVTYPDYNNNFFNLSFKNIQLNTKEGKSDETG